MSALAPAVDAPARPTALGQVHALLGVQSIIVVLLSLNRLSTLTLGYVAGNEFLRWVDLLKHWVFFAGFVLTNAALMLLQARLPHPARPGAADLALLVVNGLFIGAGVFANLALEVIGLDLYVVALLAGVALYLVWRHGRQPLLVYYAVAFGGGLVSTGLFLVLT